MNTKTAKKNANQARRAHRVRTLVRGTTESPRLTVKRSSKHIYVQLINDETGKTLAAASDKEVKGAKPLEVAAEVGKLIAKKAKDAGVSAVVFDRGSYRYHGRVAALANGAREGGLTF